MYNLVSAPVVQSHYHQVSDNSRYHPYQSRPNQTNSYPSSMNTSSSSGTSHIMDPFALPPYCMPGAYDTRPATLTTIQWEDEKTFCYLVEIKGVSVGRRKDNNMINGTKLLNLSGMTRGKRDGILKSELERSVIKSGLMVLKGVWISFERAKELAKEYGVYDLIHPLLEWDIESYYYRSILDVSPPHPLGNNDHRWFMPFPAPIKALPPHHGQKLPLQYYNLPPLSNHSDGANLTPPLSLPISQQSLQTYTGAPSQWETSLPLYAPSSADGSYSDTIVPTANTSPLDYHYARDSYSNPNPNVQYHY